MANAHYFWGNRKLKLVIQNISSHYFSSNNFVKRLIVNEIFSRMKSDGSKFLKLADDDQTWNVCTELESCSKIKSCFEDEIDHPGNFDLWYCDDDDDDGDNVDDSNNGDDDRNDNSHIISDKTDLNESAPTELDVVLRGGPLNEQQGNSFLVKLIQEYIGKQIDSYEIKRVKCRAILDRMIGRGSRFFLKLKENDDGINFYRLSNVEAEDIIYTAFRAEEDKVQLALCQN